MRKGFELTISRLEIHDRKWPIPAKRKYGQRDFRGKGLSEINLSSIGLDNVFEILLSDNNLEKINLSALRKARSLKRLNLRRNCLKSIDLRPLAHVDSLESLDLSDNQIQEINLHPLGKCKKLRELRISGNNLSYIDLKPLAWLYRPPFTQE